MNGQFRLVETEITDRVYHYKIWRDDDAISFDEILGLWRADQAFRRWYTDHLRSGPFRAFRWETPVLTRDKLSRDFEFVLVDANSFVHRSTDKFAFANYFNDDPVVSFPNLGGDGLMIVPSPQVDDDVYGHFAAFLRGAPDTQIQAMWTAIAAQVSSMIDENPRWLSTAGGGVAWLHVRLDSRPKYYHYQPFRDVNYVGK